MRLPLVGDILDLQSDLVGTFRRLKERAGGVADLQLGPVTAKLISDPELIERILLNRNNIATKSRYTHMMSAAFGQSLVIAEGESWRRQRRYLNPHFSRRAIINWKPFIETHTQDALTNWAMTCSEGQSVKAEKSARLLIQSIMGSILFGDLFPQQKIAALTETIEGVSEGLFSLFLRKSILVGPLKNMPTPSSIKLKGHLNRFGDFIEELYDIDIPDDHPSLAAAIIRACPRTTEGIREVKDQIAVLYFAGHDTTARALAWTIYYLALNPQWIEAIATSVAETDRIEANDIAMAVVSEAMRLRPPAYAIDRKLAADVPTSSGVLKKGSLTPLAIINVLHDDDLWKNANQFDPQRFLQPDTSEDAPANRYLPFGHGQRKCIGMDLALYELTYIVSVMCSRYYLEAINAEEVGISPSVTLGLKPDLEFKISPLTNSLYSAPSSLKSASA